MALDNLLVLDGRAKSYADRRLRARLVRSVEAALTGEAPPPLPAGEAARPRTTAFEVAPSVAIADRASTRTTVVEVNARDRPALLAALASAIHGQGHQIHSAHIATYGERAVDVFYLTRADGRKLDPADVEALRAALLHAAAEPGKAKAA
jgi:[protein-PII] uridylyltransferase